MKKIKSPKIISFQLDEESAVHFIKSGILDQYIIIYDDAHQQNHNIYIHKDQVEDIFKLKLVDKREEKFKKTLKF